MDEGGTPPGVNHFASVEGEPGDGPTSTPPTAPHTTAPSTPSLLSNHVEPEDFKRVSQKQRPLVSEIAITIVTIAVVIGTFVYVLIRKLRNSGSRGSR